MDIKIIFGIVAFAIIALVIGLMIPGGKSQPVQIYPWQVDSTPGDSTRVFGLTLGESSLRQAEQAFSAEAELSLFVPVGENQLMKVEAYFDKVTLGGLSARVVVAFDFTPEQLQLMYDRGIRISTLGDGSRKISLHPQDVEIVRGSPVASITYLPRIRLETALVEKRFGKPADVIEEKDSATTHWLYPNKGLDIALDDKGNGVLQYVPPSNFEQLIEPLQ